MATFSKKGDEEEQQQGKNGYWRNELYSLGVLEQKQNKKEEEVRDNKAELENLANIIKQSMFEDYRLAYSEEGDAYKEEQNRLSLLDNLLENLLFFSCWDSSENSAASHRPRYIVVHLLPLTSVGYSLMRGIVVQTCQSKALQFRP